MSSSLSPMSPPGAAAASAAASRARVPHRRAKAAAAASIGAGIAWKLWQKPPITTLLVGAGVAALFGRSSVHEIDVDPYDLDRPSAYVPGGVAGYGYGTKAGAIEQKAIGGATIAI